MSELVHATTIALDGHAALLRGPSGSGKSDLAVRCVLGEVIIAGARRRACLVADDQTLIERHDKRLVAHAPAAIAGRIEVRGIGIVPLEHVAMAEIVLVVDLVAAGDIERLPLDETTTLLGIVVPLLRLAPFEASAPVKLMLALDRIACGQTPFPG